MGISTTEEESAKMMLGEGGSRRTWVVANGYILSNVSPILFSAVI